MIRVEDLGSYPKTRELKGMRGEFRVEAGPNRFVVRWDGIESSPCGVDVDFESGSVRFIWGEKENA